jgi:uncharacterized protein (DUF924 family)
MEKAREILRFWFGDDDESEFRREWFIKDPEFDALIAQKFGDAIEPAVRGDYDQWAETPRGRLALIVLLDQFPRNLFRGSPRSWTQDLLAQKHTLEGMELGDDEQLSVIERTFFYLPLEHAEDLHLQELSVQKYRQLADLAPDIVGGEGGALDYAVRHHEIIERFGRFPHRNEIIGRPSTPKEVEFLEQPNSSF